MISSTATSLISFLAGGLVATAGVPRVLERITELRAGRAKFGKGDLWRDSLVALGNALWVLFGLITGHFAITLFCGIQVLLMIILVTLNFRARGASALATG